MTTADGKVRTGILVERSPEAIKLKDAQASVVRIALKDVESMQAQKKSLMPEQLLAISRRNKPLTCWPTWNR